VPSDWLLIPLGFAVGTYGAVVGAGGGFLLVPVLLLLYPSASPATITSISLAVVCGNAVAGSIAYARARRIDVSTGLILAAATVPGAVLGALVVDAIPRSLFSGLFGAVLLSLGLFIMTRPRQDAAASIVPKLGMRSRVVVDALGIHHEYHFFLWHGVLLSAGIGFLSSLLGIGGGILQVPTMVLVLHFPMHIATATSQLILAVMAGAGTAVHLATGELAFGSGLRRSLLLTAGVLPGAFLGAWLSRHIEAKEIIRLLAVGLVLIGLRLLVGSIIE
jgi:uncharacterized protein